MLKVYDENIFGFGKAINGMRNPLNSWSKADSQGNMLGEKDLELCEKLIIAGTEHRKFMRMIHVQFNVIAPLYWWKEFDTYKVGTTANSCSTMHKIQAKEFTEEDFSCEKMERDTKIILGKVIDNLNYNRKRYIQDKIKNKDYWWQMIQLLPSSYNQLRTIDTNYEVLLRIYFQRKEHKLDEWHILCNWIKTLPYMQDFIEKVENS